VVLLAVTQIERVIDNVGGFDDDDITLAAWDWSIESPGDEDFERIHDTLSRMAEGTYEPETSF
jgi:hypothetical protein